MSTNENFAPMKDASGMPVDPNVRVPDHVRQAAEAAEAIHKQAYTPPADPVVQQTPEPGIDPQPTAAEIAARAAEPQPQVQPVQQQAPAVPQSDFTDAAPPEALRDSEWARRYNSMKGRYDALLRAQGGMEEQMRQMAAELVRTQQALEHVQSTPVAAQQVQRGQDHGNLITEEDRQNYGEDLIDMARRAARETVSPELEQLRADNQRLTQRVQSSGKREMFVAMDTAVPAWRQINRDPRFIGWLRLPNIYTGQARKVTLDNAVRDADASRAIAVFKDFLAEAAATGQQVPAARNEQQAQTPLPHTPALSLDTLAAPGRARPASGDSQVPADKPTYTRAQISKFYDDKRRGLYAGRDADVAAFEADLTAAQREGRIRG